MAASITEIKNLTTSTSASAEDLAKFSNQKAYSNTISADGVTLTAEPTDNIQVSWTDGDKVIARAVNGSGKADGTKFTISGLTDVSKYSFGLNGQIGIGPNANPDAVLVSVRIGNLPTAKNPKADWLIDFSDKEDGAPGTSIALKDLVEWIQSKSKDTTKIEYPKLEKGGKPEDFQIVFKEFYYNITQNTFDFNVQTKDGNEIKFGDFTIKKAGFRITNTPVVLETKALLK